MSGFILCIQQENITKGRCSLPLNVLMLHVILIYLRTWQMVKPLLVLNTFRSRAFETAFPTLMATSRGYPPKRYLEAFRRKCKRC